MKYLVKNRKTGEETLCKKVVVDNHDYYLNDSAVKLDEWCFEVHNGLTKANLTTPKFTDGVNTWWLRKLNMNTCDNDPQCKKVIATNNKSLDLPQVVGERDELAENYLKSYFGNNDDTLEHQQVYRGFLNGYNKAKETYQFTKEDMVEFAEWFCLENIPEKAELYFGFTNQDMFLIWQEQRITKVEVE